MGFGESKGQLLQALGTWVWTWTSSYKTSWVAEFSAMHLCLPIWSQVRLGRVMLFSEKLRTEMLWIQRYLTCGLPSEKHSILGADLSRQDALVVNGHAEDCCIGGSICRDRAAHPDHASDCWGSFLLSIHRKSPSYQGCPHSLSQVDRQTHPMKAAGPTTRTVITVSSVIETYYRPAV